MQTRRDALADAGLAIRGARGKFSKDAMAWLEAQRAKGVKFSDDDKPAKATKPKADSSTPEPEVVKAIDPRDTQYLGPNDYRFPEAEYRALGTKDGKTSEYSLREACNTCMVSLVNHMCDRPTILGDVQIKIVKRKE